MVFATNASVVVFQAYRDPLCTTRMYNNPVLFMPLLDRVQGIDAQVSSVIYGGSPPSSVGSWTFINDTAVTLCNLGDCKSWSVYPTPNMAVCQLTPSFGYGRFYTMPGPVSMELYRTTGPTNRTTCVANQWVAYGKEISDASAPCSTTDYQVFWDGASKLSYFYPRVPRWNSSQPCGPGPYPGETCASGGLLYCATNADCAIEHPNIPLVLPWFSVFAVTIKVVTSNQVSLAAVLTPSLLLLLIIIII